MKSFEEYITSTSLEEDYEVLCNDATKENAPETNDIIINLVMKYLAKYLDVSEITRDNIDSALGGIIEADFPLSCLIDIRSTAALFKEIMFADNYEKGDSFLGIDLGCGSGILTLAMQINAVRNKIKNITCVGLDYDTNALEKAENILDFAEGDIYFDEQDITNKNVYQWISKKNPSMIISETINTSIESFTVSDIGEILSKGGIREEMNDLMHSNVDPYKIIIEKLLKIPGFHKEVQTNKTYLFPDVINNSFKINRHDTALSMRDYPHFIKLSEFQETVFSDYEDFDLSRWPREEETRKVEQMLCSMLGI